MSEFSELASEALPIFQEVFGDPVTYSRGNDSVPITAIKNSDAVDIIDSDNVRVKSIAKDFAIKASDIDFGAGAVAPARGDLITDANGKVYDVRDDSRYIDDSAEWKIPVEQVNS